MNSFRRIYFDLNTGNVLVYMELTGYASKTSIDEDKRTFKELAERINESYGVLELENNEYAEDFSQCSDFRINPITLKLEFSYPDPNVPQEEQQIVYQKPLSEQVSDLQQSIAELSILLATPQM